MRARALAKRALGLLLLVLLDQAAKRVSCDFAIAVVVNEGFELSSERCVSGRLLLGLAEFFECPSLWKWEPMSKAQGALTSRRDLKK